MDCDCRAGGVAHQVTKAVAELYKALKEGGRLQKHVESWKEGLEEQSVAHGVRGASLHQAALWPAEKCWLIIRTNSPSFAQPLLNI